MLDSTYLRSAKFEMTLKFRIEGWAHKLAHKGHRIVPSGRETPEAVFKIIALIGQHHNKIC